MTLRGTYFKYAHPFLLVISALIWFSFMLLLALKGRSAGFAIGPISFSDLSLFLSLLIGAHVFPLVLGRYLQAENVSASKFLKIYLTLAFCAHALAAWGGEPWLDDDLYRYVWDGFVSTKGQLPLLKPPADYSMASGEWVGAIWQNIAYKDALTVYPPLAQIIFALQANLFWDVTTAWCLLAAASSLMSLYMLVQILLQRSYSLPFICYIGLNPLWIKEFADSAHLDIFAIFLILAAVRIYRNTYFKKIQTWLISILVLGAALIKLWPVLFAPLFFTNKSLRNFTVSMLLMGLAGITIVMSYFETTANVHLYFIALGYFNDHWVFNPHITEVMKWLFQDFGFDENSGWTAGIKITRIVGILGYLITAVYSLKVVCPKQKTRLILLGITIFILMAPVINPWYLCWLLILPCWLDWQDTDTHLKSATVCLMALPLVSANSYLFWLSFEDMWVTRWGAWLSWGFLLAFGLRSRYIGGLILKFVDQSHPQAK